jgi:hypothetical protein
LRAVSQLAPDAFAENPSPSGTESVNPERVIDWKSWRRRDLAPFVVDGPGEAHLPLLTIEADHLAQAVVEMVPMRLREIVELVLGRVHAAGGDGVQQWLPEMGPRFLDQGDPRVTGFGPRVVG